VRTRRRIPQPRFAWAGLLLFLFAGLIWAASAPTTLQDFFLPGSQPNQSGQFDSPDFCDNCHGGYDTAVEPAFNWRGSMMAQAARDPLFYACLTIGNQDAPEAGDLCIRCHSPTGWLEGRSSPTDATALTSADRESVHCDFCHRLVKPSPIGVNPFPNDPDYTSGTYPEDQTYLATLSTIPGWPGNGMFIVDSSTAKRGPFTDAVPKHKFYYSPFHSQADLCGTCHDVSNPAFSLQQDGTYAPNTFGMSADVDNGDFDPHKMFPIERTYSEWKMSSFAATGVDMGGRFGGNKQVVSTCQDCHMQDVTGVGCNKAGVPTRTNLPLHDLTGGNTFIPLTLNALWTGETDASALAAGIARARNMLQKAATLEAGYPEPGILRVRVTNETGHKLPSGYPEGRRIWINVKFLDSSDNVISESGAYDADTATLAHDSELKVYEIKPGLSASLAEALSLPVGPGFHFVLNNQIYSDNRIPPRGFNNANFSAIQSPPVGYSYADGQYWDDTDYPVPEGTARAEVRLYYQSTSREFVEFMRDENHTNDWGTRLYDAWVAQGQSTPELMASTTWENLRAVTVNPIGLTFGSVPVGGTSSPQEVTLFNAGTGTVTISSLGITGAANGDFSLLDGCDGQITQGASCQIGVTFAPTASGARNATLNISSDAPSSPQAVQLAGTGEEATAEISLSARGALAFPVQVVGTPSSETPITLTNIGSGPLTITSLEISGGNSGDFTLGDDCPLTPSTLAAAGSCRIHVTFTPSDGGPRKSSLLISSNAASGAHRMMLTGLGSTVSLTPLSWDFGSFPVGTPSPTQPFKLTNVGGAPIHIWDTALTGANVADFQQLNYCPAPPAMLAAGTSCTLEVTFTPADTGTLGATLMVSHDGGGSPAAITLTGEGTTAHSRSMVKSARPRVRPDTVRPAPVIVLPLWGSAHEAEGSKKGKDGEE
jgi:Cep192 domain 4